MIYSTSATAIGGRNGTVSLDDGTLSQKLSVPGTAAVGNNPEQLFALAYAGCFDNAVRLSANRLGIPLKGSRTTVTVGIIKDAESYKLDIHIDALITGPDLAGAKRIAETAHAVCPYSNALRGNATVELNTRTETPTPAASFVYAK